MNWTSWLILLSIVVVFLLIRRIGQLSERKAREYLGEGALVIDVRSEGEFAAKHLRGAINIPVDRVDSLAPQRLKDRNQVLLLHCESGMRSAAAQRKLARMGFTRAYNLGSYGRAARILGR
jgi:phage shock protein E